MKVAMISEHASPLTALGGVDSGGQNVYVAQTARHLARLGWQVDVFTRRDDRALPRETAWQDGVRIVHVSAGPPERIRKEDLLPFMGEFTEFVVGHARHSDGYDLVHANFFMSALVAADIKAVMGTPFVVTFHALGKVRRLHQGEADAFPPERVEIEERAVNEADAIIAECAQDQSDLVNLYGADAARLRRVPCGFDAAEFSPMDKAAARRLIGVPDDQPVVLQLGRMVPRKGVDTVIRGIARLRQKTNSSARLLIVGGESRDPDPAVTPEIGRLMAIAAREGVSDQVTFVGSRGRAELRAYYSAADVFVTTPWYEPFGITPVEAMACGTPVIGAAVGGIKETVRDGETGFLIPPKDPDALADRLTKMLSQPSLRRSMRQKALLRARRHYTWAHVSESIAQVYREVAGRNRFSSNIPLKSSQRWDMVPAVGT